MFMWNERQEDEMFGLGMKHVRTNQDRQRPARTIVGTLTYVLLPLRKAATSFVQHVVTSITTALDRFATKESNMATIVSPISTTTMPASTKRDYLRQVLNLLLSITQFAAAALIFSSQFGNDLFYNPVSREPLILPADYTFGIWAFIFPASIAYGVYQALPRQRTNDLLRRIGFQTAFTFGCITLWSVATLFDPIRYTVPLFFGALGGLVYAVYQTSGHPRPLTLAERVFVVVPLGVYAAWCTVGTIANTSTSLFGLGYTDPIFREQTWAVMMLLVAGAISSFMTTVTRGNIPYALGIIWALIGIIVATTTERPNGAVAMTAGAMVVVVASALLRTTRFKAVRMLTLLQ